jgi:hypothetical protein
MANRRTNIPLSKQFPNLTNCIMIISVYCENNVKLVNTICGQKREYFNVKQGCFTGLVPSGNCMHTFVKSNKFCICPHSVFVCFAMILAKEHLLFRRLA